MCHQQVLDPPILHCVFFSQRMMRRPPLTKRKMLQLRHPLTKRTAGGCHLCLNGWQWIGTRPIELQNCYLQKGALRALQRAGVKVWVLSFCGHERAQEVQQKYQTLLQEELVNCISFTWSRVGRNGSKVVSYGSAEEGSAELFP